MAINNHRPINNSLLRIPRFKTKSAFDKNFKASANSIKPNTTLTVLSHPPDFGNEFNHFGNIANKVNGKAKAKPKPLIPSVNCMAPPSVVSELPNKEPKIGPVHEKDTIANVNAMKNIPIAPPTLLALLSKALLQDAGKVNS